MKYFVVSDIHDHYGLMTKALSSNSFDENNDNHKLIICGDAFYSGPEPGKLFEYLRRLNDNGKLIFIYGNHDVELLNNLEKEKFGRSGNRTCASLLVKHLTGKENLSDKDLISECNRLGFTDFLKNVPVWFYETDKYIFTHGFIPTKKCEYRPDWRNATDKEWKIASERGDGMLLSMRYGVSEPNKVIVFGHYSAARCYKMQNASQSDWESKVYKNVSSVPHEGFKPFFGKTFIAMDQSVKKTGFINCIVLED